MGDVLEMPADLVATPGFRIEREQGVAADRVAVDADRQLDSSQPTESRAGGLRGVTAEFTDKLVGIALATERMIDAAGLRWVAANNSKIAFVDGACLELSSQRTGDFSVEAEQQDTRSAPVEPMRRPDALADLIAQDLDGKACFVPVDLGTMDEQVRRLVDDDDVLIAIEEGERRLGAIRHRNRLPPAVNLKIRQKTGPLPAREPSCR